MTAYSAIIATQVDAESPVDTTLAGSWTNNVLAIAEGDATAPKVARKALAGGYVCVQGTDSNTGAGPVILPTELADTAGEFDHTTGIFTAAYAGIVRVVITNALYNCVSVPGAALVLQKDTGSGYVDIAEISPATTTGTNIPSYAYPVSVAAGDAVRLYGKDPNSWSISFNNASLGNAKPIIEFMSVYSETI